MSEPLAVYFGLILARVGAFVAVMPPFAGRTPRPVRAAFALVLSVFYIATVMPAWNADLAKLAADVQPMAYALALIREALIGAALGFGLSLYLLPARMAGEFVTQQIGLAISPQIGPTGDSSGPLGTAFETAAAMAFLAIDGHHVVLALLHASFAQVPLGGDFVPSAGPLLASLSSAQETGVLLAGPLALCLFLLAVAMAIMSRAAPQLNVYSIGFALQVIVALLGSLFLLPEFVRTVVVAFGQHTASLGPYLG